MSNPKESIQFSTKAEFIAHLKKLEFTLTFDDSGSYPISYDVPGELEPANREKLEKYLLTISKTDWEK